MRQQGKGCFMFPGAFILSKELTYMKVIHTALVRFMTGKYSNAVLYRAPSENFSIQRNYVYPKITPNNQDKGAMLQNVAKSVWKTADAGYKADFKTYASRYYQENLNLPNYGVPVNNSFGLFYKAMWQWYFSDPAHVDLKTVITADIVSMDSEMQTVKRAIDAGFLPLINEYSDLTAPIQI